MSQSPVPSARLVMADRRPLRLPRVAETLCGLVGEDQVFQMDAVSLTRVDLVNGPLTLSLALSFEKDETLLTLGVDHARSPAEAERLLARLTFGLCNRLNVGNVLWRDATTRIPVEQFVEGLKDIMPAIPEQAPTERPKARLHVRKIPTVATMDTVRNGDTRFDAHVVCYEAHLRDSLRAPSSDGPVGTEPPDPELTPQLRLSSWAMSLSAAVINLPVALPMMAYSVAKGEDVRGSALTLALAGTFVVLADAAAQGLTF